MKRSKKFLTSLGVLVLAMTIFSSNALAAESVIDNDPLSTAPGYHDYEGNWFINLVGITMTIDSLAVVALLMPPTCGFTRR